MAGRYKPQVENLESIEQVNLALKEIGKCEMALEMIDADAEKRIMKTRQEAANAGGHLREEITRLSGQIGSYAQYNKDLFKERRSLPLSWGEFGFRKSTKIRTKKTTLELLKKLGLKKFIRTKESVNKVAMKDLDDATLRQVDAVRKVIDDFFCEAYREEVNKDLLAAGM